MVKQSLISILSFILKQLLKIAPPVAVNKNMSHIARKMETYSNSFFSYHLRPKEAKDVTLKNKKDYSNIGIVIQGPLVIEENFTLETVKLYKSFFKNIQIVVSSWEGENQNYVSLIKSEDVTVVLNKKPKNAGALNSNLQIVTTLSGLRELEKKEVDFVLKTRSDQRIYNYNSIDFFQTLIKKYPPINILQKSRIVSINFTTLKYRPYSIGDMCMFGSLSDIISYWDIELEDRKMVRKELLGLTISELTKLNVAETYYCTHYLNKIGFPTHLSINNSWKAYRDVFIVIDYELADLFWCKYKRESEYKHRYYNEHSFELFTYFDWICQEKLINEGQILKQVDGTKCIKTNQI